MLHAKIMKLPAHIDPSLSSGTDISGNIPKGKTPATNSAETVPSFKIIDKQLRKVKELINEQLATPVKTGTVNKLLEYINTGSGKMIRPGLVLLAGSAAGKITDEHIRIAAIFEMVHNATLLHDDVIDDGQKRRGQATVNSLWGNEPAVLLGDFLLSRVFKMCARLEPAVAKEIAATAARVCEGELRQIGERRNWQLSESQYIDIITEKSASLFSSCCYLGGLLAKATEKQLQSLGSFGLNAGIAFQITDDLLDITGDESKTGKTIGRDVDKSKLTLGLIHLLRVADDNEKKAIKSELNTAGKSNALLAEMLKSYGSLEYARSRAQEFVTKAMQTLADLKDSNAKEALIETAKFMVNRAV